MVTSFDMFVSSDDAQPSIAARACRDKAQTRLGFPRETR